MIKDSQTTPLFKKEAKKIYASLFGFNRVSRKHTASVIKIQLGLREAFEAGHKRGSKETLDRVLNDYD